MFVINGAYDRTPWTKWGERLRVAMEQAGCSEKLLAFAMRLTEPQLSRQLSGHDSMSLTRLLVAPANPQLEEDEKRMVLDVLRWFSLAVIDTLDFPKQVQTAMRIRKQMASMQMPSREEQIA